MANHKSSKKRIRQSEKRRVSNKWQTSRTRSEVKKLRAAITDGDKETALSLFPRVQALFAKISKGSNMKKSTAGRRTGRLAAQVAKL